MFRHPPTPLAISRYPDSYPSTHAWIRRGRNTIVEQPRSSRDSATFGGEKVRPVLSKIYSKGLAKFCGPGTKISLVGSTSALAHLVKTVDGSERTYENGGGDPFIPANDVRTEVHSVGEIHVEQTSWTEHRRVTRRLAPVCMACGVILPVVSLDFDDATTAAVKTEDLVEQLRRHLRRRALEKCAVEH